MAMPDFQTVMLPLQLASDGAEHTMALIDRQALVDLLVDHDLGVTSKRPTANGPSRCSPLLPRCQSSEDEFAVAKARILGRPG